VLIILRSKTSLVYVLLWETRETFVPGIAAEKWADKTDAGKMVVTG